MDGVLSGVALQLLGDALLYEPEAFRFTMAHVIHHRHTSFHFYLPLLSRPFWKVLRTQAMTENQRQTSLGRPGIFLDRVTVVFSGPRFISCFLDMHPRETVP